MRCLDYIDQIPATEWEHEIIFHSATQLMYEFKGPRRTWERWISDPKNPNGRPIVQRLEGTPVYVVCIPTRESLGKTASDYYSEDKLSDLDRVLYAICTKDPIAVDFSTRDVNVVHETGAWPWTEKENALYRTIFKY